MSTTSDNLHSEPLQSVAEYGSHHPADAAPAPLGSPAPPAGMQDAAATPMSGTSVSTASQAVVTPPEQGKGGSVVAVAQKLAGAPAGKTNGEDTARSVTKSLTEAQKAFEQRKNRKVKKLAIPPSALFANDEKAVIFSADEWEKRPFHNQPGEQNFITGSPENPTCRPMGKHFILAPEKSLKTTFCLRLAASMASGKTLFPLLPVNPKPRVVLYLHGELSMTELEDRIAPSLIGLPEDPKLGKANLFHGRLWEAHLIKQKGREIIEEALDQIYPDVLIIDPWQEFLEGADDNSFKDMSQAMAFIDELIRKYRLTVFIIVHEGKDHSKGARGSSSISGWRDTQIKLTATKENNLLTGADVVVEPRWCAKIPPKFHVALRNGTVWAQMSDDEAVLQFLKTKQLGEEFSIVDVQKAQHFIDHPVSDDTIRRAVNRLKKNDLIVITDKGGKGQPLLFALGIGSLGVAGALEGDD